MALYYRFITWGGGTGKERTTTTEKSLCIKLLISFTWAAFSCPISKGFLCDPITLETQLPMKIFWWKYNYSNYGKYLLDTCWSKTITAITTHFFFQSVCLNQNLAILQAWPIVYSLLYCPTGSYLGQAKRISFS